MREVEAIIAARRAAKLAHVGKLAALTAAEAELRLRGGVR
jgi:hypothetical protein